MRLPAHQQTMSHGTLLKPKTFCRTYLEITGESFHVVLVGTAASLSLSHPFPDTVYGANVFLHPSSVYRSPHAELHEEINIFIELLTDLPLPRAVSKCCSSVKQLGNNCRALKVHWGFNKLFQVCIQAGCIYVCAACSIGNMMHFHQMKMIIVRVVVYYI